MLAIQSAATEYYKEECMSTNVEIAKRIIEENIEDAKCGLFFSRNIMGDRMTNIYDDENISIDICYGYMYFEVFGLTREEQEELEKYYIKLGGM